MGGGASPAVSKKCITRAQGYAWEITTAEGGWGLDGVLQSRGHVLDGIANGIDTTEWSPALDTHLAATYTADDMSGAFSLLCDTRDFPQYHPVGPMMPRTLRRCSSFREHLAARLSTATGRPKCKAALQRGVKP